MLYAASGLIRHLNCTTSTPMWKTGVAIAAPFLVIISATIAFLALQANKAMARKKATLDLIEKTESSDYYRNLNKAFSAARNTQGGVVVLNQPRTDEEKKRRGEVLAYLNHYEFIAIGIAAKILDEQYYGDWMKSIFVRDWNAAAPFIQNERWRLNEAKDDFVYHKKFFKNFQSQALRWSPEEAIYLNEERPPGKPPLPAQGAPVPVGDEPVPQTTPD